MWQKVAKFKGAEYFRKALYFQHGRPFQQVSLSHFCLAGAAPVNCKCCYWEVERSRRNSGRQHKLTERDCRVLKRVAHNKNISVLGCNTHYQVPNCFWKLFVGSFMKLVSMAKQPHTSPRSPCAMPSVGWSGVKLAAIAFSGVMNHAPHL